VTERLTTLEKNVTKVISMLTNYIGESRVSDGTSRREMASSSGAQLASIGARSRWRRASVQLFAR
jgi:hypothetical protein